MSPGDLDVDLQVSWPGADLAALDAGTAGLQTGPRDLVGPDHVVAGTAVFHVAARIVTGSRWRGPMIHGKGAERHLYLSFRAPGAGWHRRVKIMLPDAAEVSGDLAAVLRDVAAARAGLGAEGWIPSPAPGG